MPVKITILNNGALKVEGDDFVIQDPEGKPFGLAGRTVISLCRCGHSAKKPFCDAGHREAGFESSCAARDLPPPQPK
jgi:CDGSH-type Zn-finger protein